MIPQGKTNLHKEMKSARNGKYMVNINTDR